MAELNNTIVRGNLRVVSQMEAQEILENGTSLANKYYLASNPNGYTSNTGTVTSVAVKMNGSTVGTVTTSGTIDLGTVLTSKPSYTFAGTAVTSGGNSGTAVAAVTGYANFSGGSGSLTSNDTSSGGIAYISTGSTTSVVTGVAANGTATAVTGYGSFSGGSGSLTGNTTASGGIAYVEASLSGTELTLTVKYLHHGHTAASLGTASTATVLTGVKASGTANAYTSLTTKYLHHGHTAASLGSPSTSNCAPSGHTHSVTAAGNIS